MHRRPQRAEFQNFIVTVVPPLGVSDKEIIPPCTVIIWRANVKPIPLPCRFVVKKGTNTFSRWSGEMPTPLSTTLMTLRPSRSQGVKLDRSALRIAQSLNAVTHQIDECLIQKLRVGIQFQCRGLDRSKKRDTSRVEIGGQEPLEAC